MHKVDCSSSARIAFIHDTKAVIIDISGNQLYLKSLCEGPEQCGKCSAFWDESGEFLLLCGPTRLEVLAMPYFEVIWSREIPASVLAACWFQSQRICGKTFHGIVTRRIAGPSLSPDHSGFITVLTNGEMIILPSIDRNEEVIVDSLNIDATQLASTNVYAIVNVPEKPAVLLISPSYTIKINIDLHSRSISPCPPTLLSFTCLPTYIDVIQNAPLDSLFVCGVILDQDGTIASKQIRRLSMGHQIMSAYSRGLRWELLTVYLDGTVSILDLASGSEEIIAKPNTLFGNLHPMYSVLAPDQLSVLHISTFGGFYVIDKTLLCHDITEIPSLALDLLVRILNKTPPISVEDAVIRLLRQTPSDKIVQTARDFIGSAMSVSASQNISRAEILESLYRIFRCSEHLMHYCSMIDILIRLDEFKKVLLSTLAEQVPISFIERALNESSHDLFNIRDEQLFLIAPESLKALEALNDLSTLLYFATHHNGNMNDTAIQTFFSFLRDRELRTSTLIAIGGILTIKSHLSQPSPGFHQPILEALKASYKSMVSLETLAVMIQSYEGKGVDANTLDCWTSESDSNLEFNLSEPILTAKSQLWPSLALVFQ